MHKTASDDPTTVIGSDVRWRNENLQVHSIVGSSRTRLPPPDRAKWRRRHVNMHYAFIRFRLHNRLKETMAFVSHSHEGPAHTTTLAHCLAPPAHVIGKKEDLISEKGRLRASWAGSVAKPSFLPPVRSRLSCRHCRRRGNANNPPREYLAMDQVIPVRRPTGREEGDHLREQNRGLQ